MRRFLWGPASLTGFTLAAVVAVADQASKLYLLHVYGLAERGSVRLAPFLDFVLTWNRGISYGLLQQDTALGRALLLGFTLGALALLWVWLARSQGRLLALSLGLVIGGALGNAVDRALYGAVVDFVFFHVDFGSWEFRWYVFNLADAAIVAGVAGLLYDSLVPARAAKAP